MPSPFRLFSAGSAIGPGIGAPRRGVRNQIADILKLVGHPPEAGGGGGFGGLDDAMGLVKSIRNFQSDLKLKPDGVVNPGGPTENLMNAFAVAQQKGGPRLVEALKPAMRDLSGQGLTFTPDPRNPEALGMWRDARGHRVEPDRVGNLLRKVGPGTPDLDGKQQLFVERLVGKTGRDKMMKAGGTDVPAAAESGVAAPVPGSDSLQGGEGQDTLESATGDDDLNREDRFTSGAVRRLGDRIVSDTDNSTAQIPPKERIDPRLEVDDPNREKNFTSGSVRRAADRMASRRDQLGGAKENEQQKPGNVDRHKPISPPKFKPSESYKKLLKERQDGRTAHELFERARREGTSGLTKEQLDELDQSIGRDRASSILERTLAIDALSGKDRLNHRNELDALRDNGDISNQTWVDLRNARLAIINLAGADMLVAGSRDELSRLEKNSQLAGNILGAAGRLKALGPGRHVLSVGGAIARGTSRNVGNEIEQRESRIGK